MYGGKRLASFCAYRTCYLNTPSLWFKNRLTTWAPILELLQGDAEIRMQFRTCKVLTYHKISSIIFVADDVDYNLMTLVLPTHSMEWVLLHVIPGRSTVRRIIWRAEKMNELHIHICNYVAFSVGLDTQRHGVLNAQCNIDIWATIDLVWNVPLLFRSPCHPWSAKMQAVHKGSRKDQCFVHFMPVEDIDHWEMSGTVSTLIFVILPSATITCPSLLLITFYGGWPW